MSPDLNRTLTYDALGRFSTATDGTLNKTLTYGYDAAGNRTSLVYDGLTTKYGYDADHRLTQISGPDGEATSFTYDAAGRRTSLIQGNSVVTSTTYDAANRKTAITSPVQSFAYTYDLAGNPLSKTFADGTSEAYGYDRINELTSVATPSYTQTYLMYSFGDRNTMGVQSPGTAVNTSSFGYTTNTFHQVTQVFVNQNNVGDTWTYTYDNNGNRTGWTDTRRTAPAQPQQNTTYAWSLDDRLTSVTLPSLQVDTFAYDANGIRVGKSDSQGNVRYLLDGPSIVATYDAATKQQPMVASTVSPLPYFSSSRTSLVTPTTMPTNTTST